MNEQSEFIGELIAAFIRARSTIQNPKWNKSVEYNKVAFEYADLSACIEAVKEPLAKEGLTIIQTTGSDEYGNYLKTILAHTSGQWIAGKLYTTGDRHNMQSVGSAVSYARRYGLSAMINISSEKDTDAKDIENPPATKHDNPFLNTLPKEGVPIVFKDLTGKSDPKAGLFVGNTKIPLKVEYPKGSGTNWKGKTIAELHGVNAFELNRIKAMCARFDEENEHKGKKPFYAQFRKNIEEFLKIAPAATKTSAPYEMDNEESGMPDYADLERK